jgi:glycosyltransferase involved in cell wall biosynthesis
VYYATHTGKLPFRYRLAYVICGWWTAKLATRIMAISETSRINVTQLYNINGNRIVVSYPGVDFPDQSKNPSQGDYILYVGQAFPRRHLKETILAFEKVAKDFPELRLISIGPDKYETPTVNLLVSQVKERLKREAVIHKDYVKDSELSDLYAGAKALVYVSDREAFGLPPMEALSFGVPPIIADNELGHELFGNYAFYVGNSNPDGIANGIRNALTQEKKITEIKNNGAEFAKQYSWKNFTDRWLEMIRSLT